MPTQSFNALVNSSDSAIKGLVTEISEPRWNSSDGTRWCFDENNPDTPHAFETLYREAKVRIDEVYFDSSTMKVRVNEVLTIRIPGPGPAGSRVELPGYDLANNEYCCEIDGVGSKVFLLLNRGPVDTKEGPVTADTINGQMLGRWKEEGAVATSRLPERSVKAQLLTDRIKSERSKGRIVESPAIENDTTLNPLGGSNQIPQSRPEQKR